MYRIMIAEDKSLIRKGIISAIEWERLDCGLLAEASNGQEAIRLIRDLKPDILLTDIKMPYVDGLKIMDFIHENRLHTKTIVISGYDDFDFVRHALNTGSVDYILKPINSQELNRAIERAISLLEEQTNAADLPALTESVLKSGDTPFSDLFEDANGSFAAVCAWNRYHDITDLAKNLEAAMPSGIEIIHIPSSPAAFLIHFSEVQESYEVIEALFRPFYGKYYFGVSNFRKAQENLPEAWMEALKALSTKFLHDSRYFFTPCKMRIPEEFWYPTTHENMLQDMILAGNEPAARAAIRQIFPEHNNSGNQSLDEMKLRAVTVFSILSKVGVSCIEEIEEQITLLSSPEKLLEIENLEQWRRPVENLVSRICAEVQQRHQRSGIADSVMNYINLHFTEHLSLTSLSETFHVNPNYLSSLFKRKFGMGINRYINAMRLDYTCLLLRTTDLGISDISTRAGFSDPIHFSKTFKASVGMPPSEFRLMYGAGNLSAATNKDQP